MTNLQDSYRARLKRRQRQQNETLREAIEAAPHDSGCAKVISGNKFEPGPWQCNCWKAKALKGTA